MPYREFLGNKMRIQRIDRRGRNGDKQRMKSTRTLEHEIQEATDCGVLNGKDFSLPKWTDYMSEMLWQRGLQVKDMIFRCNLERSYGYQIFNGTRRPPRDTLMVLALVLGLDTAEAKRMFELAGRAPLYARCRRDAAVLYGLCHKMTEIDVHELLLELGEEGLL